ncbi:hypothetical protein COU49_00770 [Candidatus Nomurabacteria bacterium CG10_big_fil_rev_8_21_14_0_10_35_16]|uniref:Transcriptional regulator n=1 Tax=Candidatus Nomurabacteria bacterium CG10_big_fil_rev_8_21_14_0_10_35_16 TaxID=1974731 RepID=A0A2H0TC07_9BACT|nr:MAG: hypothetical protein COU49_00770 [Candidatus Nomurabacteria bacterium CG10_big_fil_rev_8_21_14_0_10_35_16]
MEILGKILGSGARIKIMRLFLLNKSSSFTNKEVVKRSRVNPVIVRRELQLLKSVNFIKKRTKGWTFDSTFRYARELENLLVSTDTLDKDTILKTFKKAGSVKLIIVAGIFIKNKDSRVDILIVGNKLKKNQITEGIRKLEAEIGTELVYAVFETKEFIYRLNIYDKLVRDILDFPHEVVLQAKELSTQALKKP